MTIIPAARPDISPPVAAQWIRAHGITGPAILGRRGYYRDTMGIPGKNDRAMYDDAIAIVTPTYFRTFNANTDPSTSRPGIAVLKAGVWPYKIGIHGLSKPKEKQYRALIQAGPVTVIRDGGGTSTGLFGINIHRGGYGTTSSEGCQTIHPDQWDEFFAAVQHEMAIHGLSSIPYVLTQREDA